MASQFEKYLGTKLGYGKTDEEMAQVLRDAEVKAMLVISTSNITDDIGKVLSPFDYTMTLPDFPDISNPLCPVLGVHPNRVQI